MDLKYSLGLNLAGLGSQPELQWRARNGVVYHRGRQACLVPLVQTHCWKMISTSNRHFILSFNSLRHLEDRIVVAQHLYDGSYRHGSTNSFLYRVPLTFCYERAGMYAPSIHGWAEKLAVSRSNLTLARP